MTLIPVQVTFHGMPHSDTVEATVRERVAWLERFYRGLVRCHVVVEIPHRHRHDGRHVQVHIDLTVAGREPIVVSHEPSLHGDAKDVSEAVHHKETDIQEVHRYAGVAVRNAFDVARRRLQDEVRVQRGDVKTHETPLQGQVAEILPIDGYGFIQAGDRRIYFSRASVLHGAFDQLTVGTPVAFAEEPGEKGPQASTVRVLGKHHYVES